ncbi:hypothetical protein EXIGLDRAFT_131452 [Exidia glandulosa HHB12029]|uniref:Uncharacterized protein n=1 Tax=Exidia glandulosa HHB12029 TaxID=1314781 RepID=A0A165G386_EXIGL|nr:hypothetical protein EXIGLDRAFT_131452 [Exidia glandulosa HHB12029]
MDLPCCTDTAILRTGQRVRRLCGANLTTMDVFAQDAYPATVGQGLRDRRHFGVLQAAQMSPSRTYSYAGQQLLSFWNANRRSVPWVLTKCRPLHLTRLLPPSRLHALTSPHHYFSPSSFALPFRVCALSERQSATE